MKLKSLDKMCEHARPLLLGAPTSLADCTYEFRCQYKLSFGKGYFCKQVLNSAKNRDYGLESKEEEN